MDSQKSHRDRSAIHRADWFALAAASPGREPVRVDELVRDCFGDAQMLAQLANVHVEMNTGDEATVRGDRHHLRQLLLNLTDNAINYNRPDGSVVIGLSRNTCQRENISSF